MEISNRVVTTGAVRESISDAKNASTSTPHDLANARLTDGYRIFSYSMSADAAAKLGLLGFTGEASGRHRIFVYDFMLYRHETANGQEANVGAGVRLTIDAVELSGNANFSSLPAIAASAEFNLARAQYSLETVGLSGPKIILTVPRAGSYNVEKHSELMKAIDAIVAAAGDPTTIVTPRVISIDVRDNTFYVENLARAFALRNIAAGRSCRDAKRGLAIGHRPAAESAVESVYREITNECSANHPNQLQKATAQQILNEAGG